MGTTVRSTKTPQAALVGRVSTRIATLAFIAGLLLCLGFGVTLGTAIVRAVVIATASLLAAPLLVWPVVSVVIGAVTRDLEGGAG